MSETAQLLDDALDRLLSRHLPDAIARKTPELTTTLKAEIEGAGFTLVLTSEAEGGLGGTLTDAANVAWRCGWHGAPVPIVDMLLGEDTDCQKGALLTAALMLGAMVRTLDIAVDHARTRTQFGRPLSKFQTIQHQLAEAASEVTITEAALAGALDAYDTGQGRALLWNSAKAQAGTAATKVAATAHQVLGAIGFTEDHELHHFTQLLWQERDTWARQAECERTIGREACAAQGGLWAYLTEKGN